MKRDASWDFLRAVAVILMVAAHGIFFFHDGTDPVLAILSRTANTIVFTVFLFVSGAATYHAYIHSPQRGINRRIVIRTLALLLGYYTIAVIGICSVGDIRSPADLFFLISQVLLFRSVPSFTEFMIPFIVFSFSVALFGNLYAHMLKHPYKLISNAVLLYIFGSVMYQLPVADWFTPYKAIFSGQLGMLRYPVLHYAPVFLAGMYWGKKSYTHPPGIPRIFGIYIAITAIGAVCMGISLFGTYPILDPVYRWPPSVGFLAIGVSAVFFLFFVYRLIQKSTRTEKLWSIFLYTGRDSYDIFIIHLIILYLYRMLHGPVYGNIWQVLSACTILLGVTAVISSLNWTFSPSVFRLGKLSIGPQGRYGFRKRYIISILIAASYALYLINADNTSSMYGKIVPQLIHPKVLLEKSWYLIENPDGLPPALHPAVTGTNVTDTVKYRITDTRNRVVIRSSDYIPGSPVPVWNLPAGIYEFSLDVQTGSGPVQSNPVLFHVSFPLYVTWGLDWEGWDIPDTVYDRIDLLSQNHQMPITHFFNPAIYTNRTIPPERKEKMTAWMTDRLTEHTDELALHLHMQDQFVTAAGVVPKTSPRWKYTPPGDNAGYDVYMTAYTPDEVDSMIVYAKRLFSEHNLPEPTGFRAGGWFMSENILDVLARNGFSYDSSGRDRSMWNGSVQSPWNLDATSGPYFPSMTDMNNSGSDTYPILEIPNNGGNTYEYTLDDLTARFVANWNGFPLPVKQAVVYLSHPQWAEKELDRADEVLTRIDQFRYDHDTGPVLYRTTGEIYRIWTK